MGKQVLMLSENLLRFKPAIIPYMWRSFTHSSIHVHSSIKSFTCTMIVFILSRRFSTQSLQFKREPIGTISACSLNAATLSSHDQPNTHSETGTGEITIATT